MNAHQEGKEVHTFSVLALCTVDAGGGLSNEMKRKETGCLAFLMFSQSLPEVQVLGRKELLSNLAYLLPWRKGSYLPLYYNFYPSSCVYLYIFKLNQMLS